MWNGLKEYPKLSNFVWCHLWSTPKQSGMSSIIKLEWLKNFKIRCRILNYVLSMWLNCSFVNELHFSYFLTVIVGFNVNTINIINFANRFSSPSFFCCCCYRYALYYVFFGLLQLHSLPTRYGQQSKHHHNTQVLSNSL